MRKLASIQKIIDIQPIEGADRIERVSILGWHCVSKKGEFKLNDFCAYFEIDSLIPKKSWSEFLFKTTADVYRLKTVRLKKVISQGLALPLSLFSELNGLSLNEGDDLTELLGIAKWEPTIPAQLAGQIRGNFPSFLHKTDEERIQSSPLLFNEIKNCGKVYAALKLDGSSMTCYNWDSVFGVCSRNLDLKEDENNSFWKVTNKYDLKNKLPNGYALQGELVGPGVQGNKLGLSDLDVYIFNVFDIQKHEYLNYEDFKSFVTNIGLKHVPIKYEGDMGTFNSPNDMLEFASIINYDNGKPAEGLVWRPVIEKISDVLNGRLSVKTISNRFLLETGE